MESEFNKANLFQGPQAGKNERAAEIRKLETAKSGSDRVQIGNSGGPMKAQIMDTAKSSALPRELELQLLVGNAVESLLSIASSDGHPADTASIDVISDLAVLFGEGVEDLHPGTRTLAQSAASLGVIGATRRAVAGTDRTPENQLQDLAAKLNLIVERRAASDADVQSLVTDLVRLHEVLAASRSLSSDEVRGFRRRG